MNPFLSSHTCQVFVFSINQLQIHSFVAENERINIKERQAEGIEIAKEKGVKFGRPKINFPPNTNEVLFRYFSKEINYHGGMSELIFSRGTFFRILKDY